MKNFIFPLVISSVLISISQTNKNFSYVDEIKYKYNELKLFVDRSTNAKLTTVEKINKTNNLYYVSFDNGSSTANKLLVFKNKIDIKVLAILNSNSYLDNDLLCSWDELFSSTTNSKNKALINDDDKGVAYGGVSIEVDKYFPVGSPNHRIYNYSASYLQEQKIKDVPAYKNTQWVNSEGLANGCVPTTAAMYFAFLEDTCCPEICDNRNLPVDYNENSSLVESFITNLGNNYFYTDNTGTYWSNIAPGYKKYLQRHSYYSYNVTYSNNYDDYYNATINAVNPVHISLATDDIYHSCLGIGIKNIFNGTETKRFVVTNYNSINIPDEYTFSVDLIRQFYFIHR